MRALDEKTQQYKGIQRTRDVALDEVAANLESQMASASSRGIGLQPVGTGLYVRNYLPAGVRAPTEVHSAVVRMVSEGSIGPGSSDLERKKPGSLKNEPAQPNRSAAGQGWPQEQRVVNGKLLPFRSL